jgi:hypothetical protein
MQSPRRLLSGGDNSERPPESTIVPAHGSSLVTAEDPIFGRMKRALRKAQRRSGEGRELGGTGATILKFLPAPLARLADRKRIGTEEIRAADDIAIAFHAQAGALMIKPPSLEKRDPTYQDHEPLWIIDAVVRYKKWAGHWTRRARSSGDRTLEIVVAAVIDERAFHAIEADIGIRHGVAARVVIAALRDYAARAGWTDSRTAEAWIEAAADAYGENRRALAPADKPKCSRSRASGNRNE